MKLNQVFKSGMLLVFILASFCAVAQTQKVSGTVVDSSGSPILGVSVKVVGSGGGTLTSTAGGFSIQASPTDSLKFDFIGYESQVVLVGSAKNIHVTLHSVSNQLADVTLVSVGYGSLNKTEVSSAITHLDASDLSSVAGNGALMSMQGKVSGLNVTNTGTGDPNSTPNIQLRGASSRNAGLGPLYVINGIPGGNIDNLNQNDILSIDVLKGGAASAIYGTRGSNGVIVITTKKGSSDSRVVYDGYLSLDYPTNKLHVLNRNEFMEHQRGTDFGGNTDWLEALTKSPAVSHKQTLQFSGGSSNTNYIGTVDYRNAHGIDLRSSKAEYGARVNINHHSKNGLYEISFNVAPRYAKTNLADRELFAKALSLNPTLSPYKEDGNYAYINNGGLFPFNPVEKSNLVKDQQEIKYLDMSGSFKLNIAPGLNTIVTGGEVSSSFRNYDFEPSILTTRDKGNGGNGRNYAKQALDEHDQKSFEWTGNYNATFGKHNIKVLGGYSYQLFTNSGFGASNEDFPSDLLTWDNLGTGLYGQEEGVDGTSSYRNESTLIAFFGRVNYNFDKKYYLSASLRHEGSSKFGENNKWGNFPAVSAAWRLTQEPFMKGIDWLNELKLRVDYGETGNQDFDSYKSLLTYSGYGFFLFNQNNYQVIGPSQTPNPFLVWEKAQNFNLGVDFDIKNGLLSGSLNYYVRKNKDLLGDYPIPVPPNIQSSIYANVGTMKNSGLELQLDAQIIRHKDFTYTASFTGATNSNEFVAFSNSLYEASPYLDVVGMPAPGSPGNLQRLQEGKRIGSFYGLKSAGVDSTGALLVYNKDGEIIRGDKANNDDKQFIGNGLPKFTASLGNNFTYKNWDLSIFFRGAFGYKLFNTSAFYLGTPSTQQDANVLTSAYDDSKYAKLTNPATTAILSDYFLESGDFVKLDNVTLGYTHTFENKYIRQLRAYVTGRNLKTFTKFTGGDPELIETNGLYPGVTNKLDYYPSSLQLIFGLQVTF